MRARCRPPARQPACPPTRRQSPRRTPADPSSYLHVRARPILPALPDSWKVLAAMHFEALIEPLDGKLPKVTYKWDPETDILVASCKGVAKSSGMNGSVDLEGADGSFVLLDI